MMIVLRKSVYADLLACGASSPDLRVTFALPTSLIITQIKSYFHALARYDGNGKREWKNIMPTERAKDY